MPVVDLSRADPRTLIGKGRVGLGRRSSRMPISALPERLVRLRW